MMAASTSTLINVTPDGLVRKKINTAGSSSLERPYDGDYCVVRYTLKTLKAPMQVIDSSQRPGTSKETAVVQIGAGALVSCVETIIKGMYPGEESSVYIDARAMHELRDMLMDNLVLDIELKTILEGPPDEFAGAMIYPLGFGATMDAANAKKLQGNQATSTQDLVSAIDSYLQGLQLLSTLENLPPHELVEMRRLQVTLHLNLSAAYVGTSAANLAIQQAQNALDIADNGAPLPEITANRCKAHFRLGQAYEKAGQFQASLWHYIRAANIKNDPSIHICVARVKPLAEKEKALAAASNPAF
jgi:hypothetical protein